MRSIRNRPWLSLLVTLLLAGTVGAATITKMLVGSTVTALSTELNSLTSNSTSALSATLTNVIGTGGDGFLMCEVEGAFTFGGNPIAGSGIAVWFAKAIDDSNFAQCGVGLPAVTLPLRSTATTTRTVVETKCAIGSYKVCALNDGTGQALAASGNTIKIRYLTPEGF
jgi:hypothetical protein